MNSNDYAARAAALGISRGALDVGFEPDRWGVDSLRPPPLPKHVGPRVSPPPLRVDIQPRPQAPDALLRARFRESLAQRGASILSLSQELGVPRVRLNVFLIRLSRGQPTNPVTRARLHCVLTPEERALFTW